MSVIGPRPTLRYQVEKYSERQRKRLDVLPGITGWAQIHGRASLSWDERIELDVWYVEHRSPLTDLLILVRTPLALFGGTYKGETGGLEGLTSAGDCGSLHLRGAARRHRLGVRRAPARRPSRPTSTRWRPRSTTPTTHALAPRIDDPGYVACLAALVAEHDVRLIVPLTDLDHVLLAAPRDALAPALVLRARAGGRALRWATSTWRISSSRSTGSPSPARAGCPTTCRTMRASRCS